MRSSNHLFHFAGLLILFCLTSCSLWPDSETEKKLEGKWEMSKSFELFGGTLQFNEVLELDTESEKFNTETTIYMTDPLPMKLAVVTYDGEWYASKEKLIMTIDEKSVNWQINDLYSKSEKREIIDEMESELLEHEGIEGGAILKITEDSFTLKDEEDGTRYTYHRIQTSPQRASWRSGNSNKNYEEEVNNVYQTNQTATANQDHRKATGSESLLDLVDKDYLADELTVYKIGKNMDKVYNETGSTHWPLKATGMISDHNLTLEGWLTEDGTIHGRYHNENGINLDFNGLLYPNGDLYIQLGHGSEKSDWYLHSVPHELNNTYRYEGTWGKKNKPSYVVFYVNDF